MSLKLFLWEKVLQDYDFGIMGAMAEDVEQARALLRKEFEPYYKEDCAIIDADLAKEPKVFDKPQAFMCWGGA